MNYILFDTQSIKKALLPFTFTRPIADIRVGILTIREKWELLLNSSVSIATDQYLSIKYPQIITLSNVFINGSILPNEPMIMSIKNLNQDELLEQNGVVIAFRTDASDLDKIDFSKFKKININCDFLQIKNTWDIFTQNAKAIAQDFKYIVQGRKSEPIPASVQVIAPENVFIEKGAKLEFVTINASAGVVYIGKDAEIMEGTVIRGSLAVCEHAQLKLATKIYGATTIGPHSRVGGEVSNSVIMGYSNKGHDGFLGNSVLGEWCNIGADSNNSNLKNNYGEVKLWNYLSEKIEPTGLQFCGLMMGDHSKCGINTMFNTGTVVGVSANIYGADFPPNFIPSFFWGGASGLVEYQFDKAMETARNMMSRRNVALTDADLAILKYIFENTKKYRNGI
ncbi:MAG: GlmU family protein [Bacteroidota bacterium]|nr:GlmU family protein [Bacteroidota bacterium]